MSDGRDKETGGQFLQRLGMDGKLWADELHKRFPAVPLDDALGWCCNMIMAGYDRGVRHGKNEVLDALVSDEVVRVATDRYLDTAFFTEIGQGDVVYVPIGDVERSVELALKAATDKLRGGV